MMLYVREKTQFESAASLGMEQVRVSRRDKKLRDQVRQKMQ